MSKPIFYEGQQVGCLMLGEGAVSSIQNSFVFVKIKNRMWKFYTNGAYHQTASPTLYPIDQYREIIAKLPAPQPEPWKPKPGEWCWFWDEGDKNAHLNKFASYDEDELYQYTATDSVDWQYCAPYVGELPDHLKEVQP